MSYGVSAALQSAVYQAMVADPDISALVGSHIFDALPSGTLPDTYISLGPEIVQDRSDMTGVGADHSFTISVVSVVSGFASTKVVAGAVCDLLHQADLTLDRGALVSMNFKRATAKRVGAGDTRRIDLRFVARVEDD